MLKKMMHVATGQMFSLMTLGLLSICHFQVLHAAVGLKHNSLTDDFYHQNLEIRDYSENRSSSIEIVVRGYIIPPKDDVEISSEAVWLRGISKLSEPSACQQPKTQFCWVIYSKDHIPTIWFE